MKSRLLATLQEQQQCYNRVFHTIVGLMPKLRRRKLVYVDSLPLETAADERTEPQAYKKLMPRIQRVYCIMHVSSHTITIDGNEIHNSISNDRATPDQNLIQNIFAQNGHHISPYVNDVPSKTPLRYHLQQEVQTNIKYVVDRIVVHKRTPSGVQYRV